MNVMSYINSKVCYNKAMIKKSEKQKMLLGEYYNAQDGELVRERDYVSSILCNYNASPFSEQDIQHKTIKHLLNTSGNYIVKPPFHCDYGYNITLGNNVFINYNCIFLDVVQIIIEDHVLIGPNTQIYTACHPIHPQQRLSGLEFGKRVTIKKNAWIGGSCVILPGVSIGENTIIGAGSVVSKSIPDNVVAYGNPCKIIKSII